MRDAARKLMTPAPPLPCRQRKRGKAKQGGSGRIFITTRNVADYYTRLCKYPLQDLHRWMAEDRRRPGGGRMVIQTIIRKGLRHAHNTSDGFLANANRLCRQPLPALRGGMDTHREGGRRADGLLARSRAGFIGYDQLRSVRGEGATASSAWRLASHDTNLDSRFAAEAAGIAALFRIKLANLRWYVPAREIAAAARVLLDDKRASMRALRERRTKTRLADREDERMARAPPRLG
jgi:hypothetical protein